MAVFTGEVPADGHVFEDIADAMPHMVWLAGPEGGSTYYNRRILEYTGLPAGTTLGAGWERLVHPDDVLASRAAWLHSVGTVVSLSMAIWTQSYSIRHRVLSLICQSPYMVNLEIGLTVNTTGEWGGFLALLTRPVREKPYFGNHVWISRKSPRNQRDSSGNSVWVVEGFLFR